MTATGARWSGATNPRDLTRSRQQKLLAEHARREAAANIDVAEVRRIAHQRGYEAGYAAGLERGLERGWDACMAAMVDEGILEPDAPGDDAGEDA
jgi:hypothetical protein